MCVVLLKWADMHIEKNDVPAPLRRLEAQFYCAIVLLI